MHSAAAVLTVHFSDVQQILLPGIQSGCEPEIISLSAFVIPADLLIISVVQVCLCIVVGFCVKHIFAVVLRCEGEWHPPGLLRELSCAGGTDSDRDRQLTIIDRSVEIAVDFHLIGIFVSDYTSEPVLTFLVHDSFKV